MSEEQQMIMAHDMTIAPKFQIDTGMHVLAMNTIISHVAVPPDFNAASKDAPKPRFIKQQLFNLTLPTEMDPRELATALRNYADNLDKYVDDNPQAEESSDAVG